jgi:excisionase family DNA binding protein
MLNDFVFKDKIFSVMLTSIGRWRGVHSVYAEAKGQMMKNADIAENNLMEFWFSLSPRERSQEFLDTSKASELTAVSQRTIRLWIDSGRIRAIRIGKKYHIHVHSLKTFIISHAANFQ